jgi:hypothetical protein
MLHWFPMKLWRHDKRIRQPYFFMCVCGSIDNQGRENWWLKDIDQTFLASLDLWYEFCFCRVVLFPLFYMWCVWNDEQRTYETMKGASNTCDSKFIHA